MPNLLLDIQNCSVVRSRPILDGISLRIAPFEHTAIIGPNGSGKSTLIRLLMREFYPSRLTDEVPINLFKGREAWSQAELRREIALVSIVFADALTQVAGLDVEDAVASSTFGTYGFFEDVELTAQMRGRIAEIMDMLGLTPLARQPVRELSTGQLRKVLIARAMILQPSLLLLDEPSLGLDIAAQTDFLGYLDRIATLTTIVMVTHHLEEIIPPIRNVLLMKDGKVFAFGPKADVLTEGNLSAVFSTPIKIQKSADGVYSMRRT